MLNTYFFKNINNNSYNIDHDYDEMAYNVTIANTA